MNVFVLFTILCLVLAPVYGSSHSEAPGTAKIPNADITDFYMFNSYEQGRANYVTFLMNVQPLQSPFGGPNYFSLSDDHFYELHLDVNGDITDDIVFQFFAGNGYPGPNLVNLTEFPEPLCKNDPPVAESSLKPAPVSLLINGKSVPIALKVFGKVGAANPSNGNVTNLNWIEWYHLNQIFGTNAPKPITNRLNNGFKFYKPFDYAGQKSFGSAAQYENYARSYIYNISVYDFNNQNNFCAEDAKMWVGQRKDPFGVNLGRIFDLINFNPAPSFPNVIAECESNNVLRDKNVDTFALEVPKGCLLPANESVIGGWTATKQLLHTNGDHVPGQQVSRMGNPLVNELVIGLPDKGNYNRQTPDRDGDFLLYVTNPTLPTIIDLLLRDPTQITSPFYPTNFPRLDLVAAFLTGFEGFNKPKLAGAGYAGDLIRLNTDVPATAKASVSNLGVIGGDLAGFPNGRRPFDDVVDIALRVMVGKICRLVDEVDAFKPFKNQVNCSASNAFIGNEELTDGAPVNYDDMNDYFPYFKTPLPGSVTDTNPTVCKNPELQYVTSPTSSSHGDGACSSGASSLTSFVSFLF